MGISKQQVTWNSLVGANPVLAAEAAVVRPMLGTSVPLADSRYRGILLHRLNKSNHAYVHPFTFHATARGRLDFCAGAQLSNKALDMAGAHVVYALEGNSGGCVGLRGWTLGDQTLTDVSWFFLLFQRHLCGPQVVHTQCLALHWAGLPEPHENA